MKKKANILVIDDSSKDLLLLESILTPHGYDVILSTDGEEALKIARNEHPDVILLDIMLIGMDGYKVCRRIKDDPKTAHIPVLLVTALTARAARLKGIEAGANDFITKPIESHDLILRVKNAAYTKSLFDQLQDNYGRLKSLEQLRDHFTRIIAHDMRKPLLEISSNLKLLKTTEKENFDPEQKKYIESCLFSVSGLIEMVNSLLEMSRLEEYRK